MPGRVPTIETTNNRLTTEGTGANVDPNKASTGGQSVEAIGEGLRSASAMLQKAYSFAEQTRAQNQLEKSVRDVVARAGQEQDFSDASRQKYQEEINKAVSDSSEHVSIPAERSLFSYDADRKAEIYRQKVNGLFMKKTIQNGKAELQQSFDLQKEKYVTAGSMAEKTSAILERDSKIDHAASVGFLHKDEAQKLKEHMNKEWNIAHLNYDIETAPDFALSELKKGQSGFYKGMDSGTMAKAQERAEKRVEYIEKHDRQQTEDQLMSASAMHALTADKLEEAKLTGKVSNSFYKAMSKRFQSNIGPTANTDPKAYVGIVNKLLDPNAKPEDSRVALLEAQADGKISQTDFKKLYQMHLTPAQDHNNVSLENVLGGNQMQSDFEKIVYEDQQKEKNLRAKNDFLKSAFDFIRSFTGKNEEKTATITQDFYEDSINKNTSPDKYVGAAKQLISEEIIKAHPEISHYPKTGKMKMDSQGNKIRIFPDGSFIEEGKK